MLEAYRLTKDGPEPLTVENAAIPADASWIDLRAPSQDEEKAAEAFMRTELPTREEASEIEFSSRFYRENGAVIMTISAVSGVAGGKPFLAPVTFVVTGQHLATLRYDELRAFKYFLTREGRPGGGCNDLPSILLGLLEAVIDRTADLIEELGGDVDRLNGEVFHRQVVSKRERRLEAIIGDIGKRHDLASKIRESLASLERCVHFAGLAVPVLAQRQQANRLKVALRDIRSLEDHVAYLSVKIGFLLDATLGLISVEQNSVIRVLTIAATVLFPPTFIATVYGMNFAIMPELHWAWGYPLSLLLMIASAILPYLYFKKKGWI